MKNKVYLLLLASVLIFSGCGKKEVTTVETKEVVETTKETQKETKKETQKESETLKETETQKETKEASATELSDDVYSFQAKLDDVVYTFPMSYSDFKAAGFEYEGDESQEFKPNAYTSDSFFIDGKRIYAYIINMGVDVKPLSECQISGVYADKSLVDRSGMKIELPKGIKLGESTKADVIAAYGEATDVYESETLATYKYSLDYHRAVEIQTDPKNGDVVSQIQVENFTPVEEDSSAKTAEVSGEATEEVLAYVAPSELGDDLKSAIIDFGDHLYQMPAPVSEFEKNGWKLLEDQSADQIAATDTGRITLMKDNQQVRMSVKNYGKTMTTVNNCFVVSLDRQVESKIPFTIQKGITIGMSEGDLVNSLEGMDVDKEESSNFIYYKVKIGNSSLDRYEIVVNEGIVKKMSLGYSPKNLK